MTETKDWPCCECETVWCGCSGGTHSYVPHYQRVLDLLKPLMVVEWGPGPNTTMARAMGMRTVRVVSIEHNPDWMRTPHDEEWWDPHWMGLLRDLESDDYPVLDSLALRLADLYFVDGRRRADCLHSVRKRTRTNAVACLHDAQRKRYHDELHKFSYVEFLDTGFAVASRTPLGWLHPAESQEQEQE